MRLHCLFEQSGTFKNEFKKLTGGEAFDYDILDDFGQTDFKVDLFKEIEKAYSGEPSVFDGITQDDVVFAFFPCTKFQAYLPMNAKGLNDKFKSWTLEKKILHSEKTIKDTEKFYSLWCKMFVVALRKKIRMVVENPATPPHFVNSYFPLEPSLVHRDRSKFGDYYVKPTQYWFVNLAPKENEASFVSNKKTVTFDKAGKAKFAYIHKSDYPAEFQKKSLKVLRSLISPDYANYFLREYIL